MTISGLDALAEKMLTKFGTDFDIIKNVQGSFNPTEGGYDYTSTSFKGKGAFIGSNIFDFNNSFNLNDNEKFYIYSSSTPINNEVEFVIDGITYSLNKTMEIIFKNNVIIYKSIIQEKLNV